MILFLKEKTCKEIGAQKSYAESLKQDNLLKIYRTRSQTLCTQASRTKPGSKSKASEMYNRFKEEGPKLAKKYKKGLISTEEFKA